MNTETIRWQRIVAMAQKYGISPEVFSASFPSEAEKFVVLRMDDEAIRRLIIATCRSDTVQQRQFDYESNRWAANPEE